MALQFRRGTAAERTSGNFVPAIGEPVYETDTNKLYIGDGTTQGGAIVSGALNLEDIGGVTLSSENIQNPDSYEITSNFAIITFNAGHTFTQGQSVNISSSSVTALNGNYTLDAVTATQILFAFTSADVANTALTADIRLNIPDGYVLSWDATNNNWEDRQALSDIVNDTTPQLGGDLDVQARRITTSTTNGHIQLLPNGTGVVEVRGATNPGAIMLNCEANTHGVTLRSPVHSAAAAYTLVLPTALPASNGLALVSDTSGNLSFSSINPATRSTANATTASIADGASADITITGAKSYMLMSIETSAAAWVTIYTSAAARTADASRNQNTDPLPGSGVIAEVITGSATTQKITPGLLGFNDESPVTTNIYAKVENQSGASAAITVTLSLLILES